MDLALTFPFITRKMLSFENRTTFGVSIDVVSIRANTILLTGFTKDGDFTNAFVIGSAGSMETFDFNLPDIPVALSIIGPSGDINKGETYAVAYLTMNGNRVQQLIRGYIWRLGSASWPASAGEDSSPLFGGLNFIESTDPIAGTELSITVPNSVLWRIISVSFTLVTAATAGSRRVHLVIDQDAAGANLNYFTNTDQIISETKNHTFSGVGSIADETDNNDIICAIPTGLILGATSIISTKTTNLAAGDNFGPMKLVVEQFLRIS